MDTARGIHRQLLTVVALAVALSLAWGITTGPAHAARRPDKIGTAQHNILGRSLTNHHTHMRTWIVGTYPYHRMVRINHKLRPKVFHGLTVSAQRCDSSHCWGKVVRGRLWSPYQPGRPLPSGPHKVTARVSAGAHGDLCIQGTTTCAAPWNWYAGFVSDMQQTLVKRFIEPCGTGATLASSTTVGRNVLFRILAQGGVMTTARAASMFAGPQGIALGAATGCVVSVAKWGIPTVRGLVSHLNPFDRSGARVHHG